MGEATAAAAREAGWNVALVPESYVAESLVTHAGGEIGAGNRVLLARAAVARDVIPDALRAAGAIVDVVDAYRNVMPEGTAGAATRCAGRGAGCGYIYEFFQRGAPRGRGSGGWRGFSVRRRAGGFDWADYQPDAAGHGLGAGGGG